MKQKILIDLDVITVGLWKGREKETAEKFLERIRKGEFEIYTPQQLFDSVEKWENKDVVKKVTDFLKIYSSEIITTEKLLNKINEMKIDFSRLTDSATKATGNSKSYYLARFRTGFAKLFQIAHDLFVEATLHLVRNLLRIFLSHFLTTILFAFSQFKSFEEVGG